MEKYYTDEKNIQLLVALLKAHGIKKVIVSPGTTNISFVGSLMYDSWFEIYSSPDERSASYMACGLAAESGEPVCLSCTGATASRNYIPGLTEAFYRKLPILAITAGLPLSYIGQNFPQMLDRTNPLNDITKYSCTLPKIESDIDKWDCELKINSAILALKRHGGGPSHINLQEFTYSTFDTKELPSINKICRFTYKDKLPDFPSGKICIYIGNHKKMGDTLVSAIDAFCIANNAVIFKDHTSGYNGKFGLNYSLVEHQLNNTKENPDLMVYIGDVSGAYYGSAKNVWRVNPDGEFRDYFKKLRNVFEMDEEYFFSYYAKHSNGSTGTSYYEDCKNKLTKIREMLTEIPFSNLWCAKNTAPKLPSGAAVHLGILNSLRCWNFFDFPDGVEGFANTGGFGIDGILSSCVGSCLANSKRLHFCIIGDLAFFYDINSLGNRHVLSNLRILLVNNGKGTEFRNFSHPGASFGDAADKFIAAGGHYGNKSKNLVRHYAEDLGFKYLSATNKEEYLGNLDDFLSPNIGECPILFEIFTDSKDESDALEITRNLVSNASGKAKSLAKKMLGDKGIKTMKKVLGKR